MCGSCRRAAPTEVCKACREANKKCTGVCRDAFVYDPAVTDEQKVQMLKKSYVEGGNAKGFKIGVIMPQHLQNLLDQQV